MRGGREAERDARPVELVDFHTFHFVQHFEPRLRLTRFGGLVTEAFDKAFDVFDFFLLVVVGVLLYAASFLALHDVFGIRHVVVFDMAEYDLDRAFGHVIEELAVVRDDDDRAGVGL